MQGNYGGRNEGFGDPPALAVRDSFDARGECSRHAIKSICAMWLRSGTRTT